MVTIFWFVWYHTIEKNIREQITQQKRQTARKPLRSGEITERRTSTNGKPNVSVIDATEKYKQMQ